MLCRFQICLSMVPLYRKCILREGSEWTKSTEKQPNGRISLFPLQWSTVNAISCGIVGHCLLS